MNADAAPPFLTQEQWASLRAASRANNEAWRYGTPALRSPGTPPSPYMQRNPPPTLHSLRPVGTYRLDETLKFCRGRMLFKAAEDEGSDGKPKKPRPARPRTAPFKGPPVRASSHGTLFLPIDKYASNNSAASYSPLKRPSTVGDGQRRGSFAQTWGTFTMADAAFARSSSASTVNNAFSLLDTVRPETAPALMPSSGGESRAKANPQARRLARRRGNVFDHSTAKRHDAYSLAVARLSKLPEFAMPMTDSEEW